MSTTKHLPGRSESYLPDRIEPELLDPAVKAILSGLAASLCQEEDLRVGDRKTILVIDDYKTSAAGWGLYLHNAKYSVETAYSPEEGLQLFATQPIDLVLLDYAMPAIDGGQVAATMKNIKPDVPILMLSGVPHVPERDLANIDAFVQKGQEPAVVLQKIEQLLARPEQAA
jgi:CheY-like chemotaxis protein